MSVEKKKVGLFFGSFAPFHNGHLLLVKQFYRSFNLNEVRIILTPCSPFKNFKSKKKKNAENIFNIFLLRKIVQKIPFLRLDLIETKMKPPHYSALTIEKIRKGKNEPVESIEYYFLVGSDNFEKIHLWYKFPFLLQNVHLVCYPRNYFNLSDFNVQKKKILSYFNSSLNYNSNSNLNYSSNLIPKISFLQAKKSFLSSTLIRKKIKNKKSTKKDIPAFIYKDFMEKVRESDLRKILF